MFKEQQFMARLLGKAEYSIQWLTGVFFKSQDTIVVADRWNEYSDQWADSKAVHWLYLAGGLPITTPRTETELLELTSHAPSNLLFGLSYGKWCDAMAHRVDPTSAHNIDMSKSQHRVMTPLYIKEVLDRGHELAVAAETEFPDYFESLPVGTSQISREELVRMAAEAPDAFTLGQATSWLVTNIQIFNPQILADLQIPCRRKDERSFLINRSACNPSGIQVET